MKSGDKVKIKFGGGHIGMVVAKKFECSYSMEGKPMSGYFTEAELEITNQDPPEMEYPQQMGFRAGTDD